MWKPYDRQWLILSNDRFSIVNYFRGNNTSNIYSGSALILSLMDLFHVLNKEIIVKDNSLVWLVWFGHL